jgi:membrane protein implicated in regulation of membrane protease activity
MIGLLLIYWIGKGFYDLAGLNGKSEWGFAILGVVVYYAGTFIGGVILTIFALSALGISIEGMSEILLGILAIPFGLLAAWGLYKLLQHQWENKPKITPNDDVLDGDIIQ